MKYGTDREQFDRVIEKYEQGTRLGLHCGAYFQHPEWFRYILEDYRFKRLPRLALKAKGGGK